MKAPPLWPHLNLTTFWRPVPQPITLRVHVIYQRSWGGEHNSMHRTGPSSALTHCLKFHLTFVMFMDSIPLSMLHKRLISLSTKFLLTLESSILELPVPGRFSSPFQKVTFLYDSMMYLICTCHRSHYLSYKQSYVFATSFFTSLKTRTVSYPSLYLQSLVQNLEHDGFCKMYVERIDKWMNKWKKKWPGV